MMKQNANHLLEHVNALLVQHNNERSDILTTDHVLKIFKTYQSLDANCLENFDLIQRQICKCCHEFSFQDLNEIFGFYSNLERQHDGFVETRIILRDEMESRNKDDMVKEMLRNIV